MKTTRLLCFGMAGAGVAAVLAASAVRGIQTTVRRPKSGKQVPRNGPYLINAGATNERN